MAAKVDVAFSGWASALVEVALDKVVDRLLLWLDDTDYFECLFKDSKTSAKEDILKEMRKLERMFARIRNYLDCMTTSRVNDSQTLLWLREFRHVAFIADDLTEEFQIRRGLSELSKEQKLGELKAFLEKFRRFIENTAGLLNEYSELANKIQEERMLRKFGGVAMRTEETSTFLRNSLFVGRDDVKQELLKSIEECQEKENLSIITILGSVGIGKTAFARQIFNAKKIKELYELRLWVSTDKEFDVKELTAMILEAVCGTVCHGLSLCKLQELLDKALTTTKFFIVLDGEWHENRSYWEKLFGPLQSGNRGCVVVVTTQSPVVSSVISNTPSICLNGLPEEDCSSIFWKQLSWEKAEMDEEMLEIGKNIVMKCAGIPLVAKAFGDFLTFKMEKAVWSYVLETDISLLPCDGNDIFASLRMCYENMPAHLKSCFTYCGIFPRAYIFGKKTLILLWMAEGLITTMGNLQMEDIGDLWFNELVNRHFLEPIPGTQCFKMNGLMREMVDLLSGHNWFVGTMINEQTKLKNQGLVRHLLVTCQEITLDSLLGCTSLRSLILLSADQCNIGVISDSVLETMKYMRVLDLANSGIKVLPASIKYLTLLRYLSLSKTCIEEVPVEVGLLSMLQTLRIRNCKLEWLPTELGNLGNLRHLDMREEDKIPLPSGVGRLIMLQKLEKFIVMTEHGHRICELQNLVGLHESLHIMNLENVLEAEEAERACLWNKEHLSRLELEWSEREHECVNEMKVLKELKPHHSLKQLVIKRYLVRTLPSWEFVSPSFLVDLKLKGCSELRGVGELRGLPCLKNLEIAGNHVVEAIDRIFFFGQEDYQGQGFCSLESLHLVKWTNLTSWVKVHKDDLPRLKNVNISECEQLKIVPDFASFGILEKLVFSSCTELRFSIGERRPPNIELIHTVCPFLESEGVEEEGNWPFVWGSVHFT